MTPEELKELIEGQRHIHPLFRFPWYDFEGVHDDSAKYLSAIAELGPELLALWKAAKEINWDMTIYNWRESDWLPARQARAVVVTLTALEEKK